jgi:fumarate reductase subunit C
VSAGHPVAAEGSTREYVRRFPSDWWLRNRNYLLYMFRDFTPVGFAVWLIWFLVEVARVKAGPNGYHPHVSGPFIGFSAICLVLAVWHSVTFLSLSGRILRVPIGGSRDLPPRLVTAANFGAWIVLSVIVGFLLVWLAR